MSRTDRSLPLEHDESAWPPHPACAGHADRSALRGSDMTGRKRRARPRHGIEIACIWCFLALVFLGVGPQLAISRINTWTGDFRSGRNRWLFHVTNRNWERAFYKDEDLSHTYVHPASPVYYRSHFIDWDLHVFETPSSFQTKYHYCFGLLHFTVCQIWYKPREVWLGGVSSATRGLGVMPPGTEAQARPVLARRRGGARTAGRTRRRVGGRRGHRGRGAAPLRIARSTPRSVGSRNPRIRSPR